jgi:hypothetical protein
MTKIATPKTCLSHFQDAQGRKSKGPVAELHGPGHLQMNISHFFFAINKRGFDVVGPSKNGDAPGVGSQPANMGT